MSWPSEEIEGTKRGGWIGRVEYERASHAPRACHAQSDLLLTSRGLQRRYGAAGFPAGGPTDVIARLVAQSLSDRLGQQFFVENIGGAGGNTAAGQVARVSAVTLVAVSPNVVVVNPSVPAKTLPELVH
jgi:hypothetical protein